MPVVEDGRHEARHDAAAVADADWRRRRGHGRNRRRDDVAAAVDAVAVNLNCDGSIPIERIHFSCVKLHMKLLLLPSNAQTAPNSPSLRSPDVYIVLQRGTDFCLLNACHSFGYYCEVNELIPFEEL